MPLRSCVLSLNCLTKAPIFTPCAPSAGPTGGAGVAWPPGHCNLTCAVNCFAIHLPYQSPRVLASHVRPKKTNGNPLGNKFPSCRSIRSCVASNVVNLPVIHLDAYRTAPHRQFHLDAVSVLGVLGLANLLDFAFHVLERAVAYFDLIANIERNLRGRDRRGQLGSFGQLLLAAEHLLHFAVGHRRGSTRQARPDEVAD